MYSKFLYYSIENLLEINTMYLDNLKKRDFSNKFLIE